MNKKTILFILLVSLAVSGCSVIHKFGEVLTNASKTGTQVAPKKAIKVPAKVAVKSKPAPKKKVKRISNNCSYIVRDLSKKHSNVVWCMPKKGKH